MTFIKHSNSFKFSAFFFLAALTWTSVVSGATQNQEISTSNPNEVEAAKQRYEAAAKRILATQPTTWLGDIIRDFIIGIASEFAAGFVFQAIEGKKQKILETDLITTARAHPTGPAVIIAGHPAIIPPAPELITAVQRFDSNARHPNYYQSLLRAIFRVLFDKIIRKTGNIDKDLDILISQKNLNQEGLLAADFDISDLEKKVLTISTKCEWFRWIVRVMEIIMAIARVNKCSPSDNATFIAVSNAVVIALCWYVYVMQSATWKKSERTKKLKILKDLLSEKKKEVL